MTKFLSQKLHNIHKEIKFTACKVDCFEIGSVPNVLINGPKVLLCLFIQKCKCIIHTHNAIYSVVPNIDFCIKIRNLIDI